MNSVYDDAIVFDGLNICNWSREIFQEWHDGGITGVSCTIGLWENFRDSIMNVVQWKRWRTKSYKRSLPRSQ